MVNMTLRYRVGFIGQGCMVNVTLRCRVETRIRETGKIGE